MKRRKRQGSKIVVAPAHLEVYYHKSHRKFSLQRGEENPMLVKRLFLMLVMGAIVCVSSCQQGGPPAGVAGLRLSVPERGGLHESMPIPITVSGPPGSEVSLTVDPEECGAVDVSSVTIREFGSIGIIFRAGTVEENCEATVTGVSGSESASRSLLVLPPKAHAEVSPWSGADTAPSVTIAPRVSADDAAPGTNRFEYFVSQGTQTPIESMKMTLAADSTVEVISALGVDFAFLDPLPTATSSDMKNWTISGDSAWNSMNLSASSESNTGGTATFDVTITHPEGTSTLTLTPTGPMP